MPRACPVEVHAHCLEFLSPVSKERETPPDEPVASSKLFSVPFSRERENSIAQGDGIFKTLLAFQVLHFITQHYTPILQFFAFDQFQFDLP